MKTKLYVHSANFTAGLTLKDTVEFELNNMALHACEDPMLIVENRRKLADFLGLTLVDFVCANQTHSANFHRVEAADRGRGSTETGHAVENTDALYTYETGLLLCTFAADCVPLLLYNENKGLIGAVHSGWQGTIKEVTLKLFEHLKNEEGCKPEDFHIQIGAALSQEKFEVDEDVYLKFKALGYADEFIYHNAETGKYHIDNQLTVKKQCELAGIPTGHISIDRTCTFMNPEGFSYREDRKSGRHMGFIVKRA
ncbi:polyphenol oxidase family protein [Planomicrobium okeanokoites]|uniref:polyphenol oxidase family protein n=1 Tax=Planomicrobium okeanokoites TaxID=244 RepID=UPI000A06C0E2|nr:polyphenol oxidase family protein [Planomicrobium okeanokoites]